MITHETKIGRTAPGIDLAPVDKKILMRRRRAASRRASRAACRRRRASGPACCTRSRARPSEPCRRPSSHEGRSEDDDGGADRHAGRPCCSTSSGNGSRSSAPGRGCTTRSLIKFESEGGWEGGPTAEELRQIREEELQHFEMLKECMQTLGGDPTAMTPAADVAAVALRRGHEGHRRSADDPGPVAGGHPRRRSSPTTTAGRCSPPLAGSMGKTTSPDASARRCAERGCHLRIVRGWLSRRSRGGDPNLEPVQP